MTELERDIRDALAGQSGARARQLAEEIAARTGLTLRRIYAMTRDVRKPRADRSDRGTRRRRLADGVADVLMKLVHELDFDAALAIETAVGNGLIAIEDAPAPGTLLRWMRRAGIPANGSEANRVCRRFEAPGPNELHQADCTLSNTWYLASDGSVGYESPRDRNKNRPGNQKPRLILFALVDDYSRVTYARYYLAENTLNWLDFLWHAWGPKDDPSRFPFEGVPKALYTDNGSCLNSARFKTACAALGVTLKFHEPHHAQSKGKVERAIGLLGRKVEKLYLLRRPSSLDEANGILYQHLVRWNLRSHGTTHVAPFARWLERSSELRRLPGEHILRALNCTRIERTLGPDLTFSVAGETFQAPYEEPFRSMPRGQKVTVEYAPECPFEVNIVLGYSSIAAVHVPRGKPLPVALPAASEAKTLAAETSERLKAVGLEELRPFGAIEIPAPDVRFLPQKSEPVEVSAELPELLLTDVAATRILQDAGIVERPCDDAGLALVRWLLEGGATVPESKVTELIRQFKGRSAREVLARLAPEERSDDAQAVSSVG